MHVLVTCESDMCHWMVPKMGWPPKYGYHTPVSPHKVLILPTTLFKVLKSVDGGVISTSAEHNSAEAQLALAALSFRHDSPQFTTRETLHLDNIIFEHCRCGCLPFSL